MQKNKGSILVLTVISIMVLSIIVLGLLTVGTTEIQTTQNFHLNKAAYYTAVEGIENIRLLIMANPGDVSFIESITKSVSETQKNESFETGPTDRQFENLGISRSYVTGNLKDFQDSNPQPVCEYMGFGTQGALGQGFAPQLRGLNLADPSIPGAKVWKVQVTAEAAMGSRKGYSEIIAGIYVPLTKSD